MNGHYSVITNFGCRWTCPYCIVRKTGLNVPVTDMQATLRTISRESERHPMRFLSFSGGGDPLFPMREPEASKRVAFYREAIRRAGDWLTENRDAHQLLPMRTQRGSSHAAGQVQPRGVSHASHELVR